MQKKILSTIVLLGVPFFGLIANQEPPKEEKTFEMFFEPKNQSEVFDLKTCCFNVRKENCTYSFDSDMSPLICDLLKLPADDSTKNLVAKKIYLLTVVNFVLNRMGFDIFLERKISCLGPKLKDGFVRRFYSMEVPGMSKLLKDDEQIKNNIPEVEINAFLEIEKVFNVDKNVKKQTFQELWVPFEKFLKLSQDRISKEEPEKDELDLGRKVFNSLEQIAEYLPDAVVSYYKGIENRETLDDSQIKEVLLGFCKDTCKDLEVYLL